MSDPTVAADVQSASPQVASSQLISADHRGGYRPEIDGLRAIAISAVLLYHAGVSIVSAGYLGVDVFFVISGYLITRILLTDLDAGKFSIARFYDRRVRRIMPALLVVSLCSAPPAYLLMLPDDLENFGQSLVATILFSNNVLLFLTSGYFEAAIEFKPLVHTWSLGVEEQYYVLIPLVISLAYRWGGRPACWAATMAICVASLLFCLWAVNAEPSANFYLLPSRAWELGVGAAIAIGEPAIRSSGLARKGLLLFGALPGLLMILVPMVVLDPNTPMPAWPTVVPVLGAGLVILCASQREVVGRLLSTAPLVGMGLVSYSAYLIHQPVFAFTRILSLNPPSTWLMLALIVPVLILSFVSWRLVETPFRHSGSHPPRTAFTVLGILAATGVGVGLVFHFSSGFYRNWPELAGHDTGFGAGQNSAFNMAPERFLNRRFAATSAAPNVMVLGDSFARDFINMGLESGALANASINLAHLSECSRERLPRNVVHNLRTADLIVWSSAFDQKRAECLSDRLATLRSIATAPVIVVGTKSFAWNNNAVMLLPENERYRYRAQPSEEVVATNGFAARLFGRDTYIDILGMLSDEQGRVPTFTPQREFISQDRSHLTRAGARYVGDLVFRHPAFQAVITQSENLNSD